MAALPAPLHQRPERQQHPGASAFYPPSSSHDPRMAAPASSSRVHSPRMSPRLSAASARGYASGYPGGGAPGASASAAAAAEEERWASEALRKRRLEAGGDPSPQSRSRAAADMEHRYGASPHRPSANRSPQSRMAMLQEEARMRAGGGGGSGLAGGPSGKLLRNGLPSPHTQLPSFNNLSNAADEAYDAEEAAAKRRRLVAEEEDEAYARRRMAEDQARQEQQQQRGGGAPPLDDARRGWRPPPPLPRSSLDGPSGVGLYDATAPDNVPLARRRGDAAQAKASRLHIDTSQSPGALEAHAHQRHGPSQPIMARSAPPQKLHFSEREELLSPYRPPEHGEYAQAGAGGPGGPGGILARHLARHSVGGREVYGGADERGGPRVPSPEGAGRPRLADGGPRGPPYGSGFPQPGGPPGSARFVPQTATLPSPAYHTTQFVRGAAAAGPGGAAGAGPTPRTAGLNPLMTARLPEHLRSPPSSKTQFLSLFSSFYDSLSDSRTLKATLEDQVRRSNTLLQTLQKSSKVLESTVERRIREERSVWEGRIGRLQRRVEELEARLEITASGSTQGDDARSAAGGDDQAAPAAPAAGDEATGDSTAAAAHANGSSGIKRSAPGSDDDDSEASRDKMDVDGRRNSKQRRADGGAEDGPSDA